MSKGHGVARRRSFSPRQRDLKRRRRPIVEFDAPRESAPEHFGGQDAVEGSADASLFHAEPPSAARAIARSAD